MLRLAAKASRNVVEGSNELGRVERLDQVVARSGLQRLYGGARGIQLAHDHHGQLGPPLADAPQESEAAHAGCVHVGQNDLYRSDVQNREGRIRIAGRRYPERPVMSTKGIVHSPDCLAIRLQRQHFNRRRHALSVSHRVRGPGPGVS